ncbi:MAG: hypothetical protein ROR55_19745 [Devosia sp.]
MQIINPAKRIWAWAYPLGGAQRVGASVAPGLTFREIKALNPCWDGWNRLSDHLPKRGKITARMARNAGATLDDLIWGATAAANSDEGVDRRLRMWMADCAARILHLYERQHPGDMRPRDAIVGARRFANGEIDDTTSFAFGADCAAKASWGAARDAALAAWCAGNDANWTSRDAARAVAVDIETGAETGAETDEALQAAYKAEREWQMERLIVWLSENEPEPYPLPGRQEVAA